MPRSDHLAWTGAVSQLTVIVLSGTDDRGVIDAAFDSGATAYVLKTSDPEAIATAIRQAFDRRSSWHGRRSARSRRRDNELLGKLTRRELEILQLVSGGRSNRQVAEILWVADQTVKFHLANIYRKLGVGSRFEAARWARESGILDVVVEPEAGAGRPKARGAAASHVRSCRFEARGRGRETLGEDSRKHRDDAQ